MSDHFCPACGAEAHPIGDGWNRCTACEMQTPDETMQSDAPAPDVALSGLLTRAEALLRDIGALTGAAADARDIVCEDEAEMLVVALRMAADHAAEVVA